MLMVACLEMTSGVRGLRVEGSGIGCRGRKEGREEGRRKGFLE